MPEITSLEADTIALVKQISLAILFTYLTIQTLVILIRRVFFKKLSLQSRMLITKGLVYLGIIVLLFIIIDILELKGVFKTLLGAAGVVGVVLGIASQTSIGNIVSGLFLISEKPFEIGDLITVGTKTGVVYSIDLLSIKLRTHSNLLIRIPNQSIISTEVINVTRFPIRRMDIIISIAYKENIKMVMDVLKDLATKNPLCLDEPEPLIIAEAFNTSSVDIKYGIWFEKTNYIGLRNSIFHEILEEFKKQNIEIPFPHISLYAGEESKAFTIKS